MSFLLIFLSRGFFHVDVLSGGCDKEGQVGCYSTTIKSESEYPLRDKSSKSTTKQGGTTKEPLLTALHLYDT